MLKTLGSLASALWNREPLRRKLQNDQWFLLMSIYIAEIFDKTARADLTFKIEETQFVTYLRNEAEQSTRKKIGEELTRRLYEVSTHPASDLTARIIGCRKWIMSLANEHARIKVALVADRDWSSVLNYPRHACVKGLGDYLDQLLEIEFTEFYDEAGSADAALTLLKWRTLRLHFDLSIANTGRSLLGDIEPENDWFPTFMNSALAVHEARMRTKLGLPSACEMSYDDLFHEYESFGHALLAGEPHSMSQSILTRPTIS